MRGTVTLTEVYGVDRADTRELFQDVSLSQPLDTRLNGPRPYYGVKQTTGRAKPSPFTEESSGDGRSRIIVRIPQTAARSTELSLEEKGDTMTRYQRLSETRGGRQFETRANSQHRISDPVTNLHKWIEKRVSMRGRRQRETPLAKCDLIEINSLGQLDTPRPASRRKSCVRTRTRSNRSSQQSAAAQLTQNTSTSSDSVPRLPQIKTASPQQANPSNVTTTTTTTPPDTFKVYQYIRGGNKPEKPRVSAIAPLPTTREKRKSISLLEQVQLSEELSQIRAEARERSTERLCDSHSTDQTNTSTDRVRTRSSGDSHSSARVKPLESQSGRKFCQSRSLELYDYSKSGVVSADYYNKFSHRRIKRARTVQHASTR